MWRTTDAYLTNISNGVSEHVPRHYKAQIHLADHPDAFLQTIWIINNDDPIAEK